MSTNSLARVRNNAWLLAVLGVPPLLLLLLRNQPAFDVSHQSVHFHLVIVTGIAASALTVAVFAAAAAIRIRRTGVVLLAAGCFSCGLLMLVHGLVTPGVANRPFNFWVVRTPVIAIFVFALCQAAAALVPRSRLARTAGAHPVVFLGVLAAVLVTFAAIVVADSHALHGDRPVPHETALRHFAAVVSIAVLLPTTWQHWRRYRLGRDAVQMVLAFAAAMSIGAVGSLELGRLWRLSWWDYHVYLFTGFGAAALTIFRRYQRSRTVDAVLRAAFEVDPLEHISQNYPEALRALVAAVEVKDSYTHGHSRRTAEIALALGARLGLPPEDLRQLAQGAYLHDVGKIAIPDEILNKPSHLTPHERELIETHSAVGAEMVGQAASLAGCVPIVRHHHERYDGAGYPDGIAGRDIPFLARVTAVADVWDALISDRAYRPGWSPQQALAHIVDGSGHHFDPVVVEALVQLAGEWGYKVAPVRGDGDEAWQAMRDCHEVGDSRVPVLNRP